MLSADYGLDCVMKHIEVMRSSLMTTRETRRYIETEIKGKPPKATYKKLADEHIMLQGDGTDLAFYVGELITKKPLEPGVTYRITISEIRNPDVT